MPEKDLEQKATECLAKEGKYLTFALGKEDYGLEILKVREIIGMMEVTAVPQVPEYVKGVINLRGKVIPVISLRRKFGMEEVKDTEATCIVVVNLDDILIGVIIDQVREVLDIHQANIEPAPNFGASVSTEFILGMGKIGEEVKILLNIEKILSDDLSLVSSIEK